MSEQLFETTEAVASFAAERVVELCHIAIEKRGVCHLVLAGGRTPKRCYELLRDMQLPWQAIHIWFGDERCLPIGDSERNDVMADEALLKHVSVPSQQIHRIAAELGPETAADGYAKLLAAAPAMDIVLFGMGEDGHTASLFPDNPALRDKRFAVPIYDSPKPPSERVSMGYALFNAARHRLILVTGKGKAEALSRIRSGVILPIARLRDSEWLIDADAMGSEA